jgi:hypothetical protein
MRSLPERANYREGIVGGSQLAITPYKAGFRASKSMVVPREDTSKSGLGAVLGLTDQGLDAEGAPPSSVT